MRPTPHELLSASDVSAFLVSDSYNVRYLTGVHLESAYVLVTPRRYTLFVDDLSRYTADTTARHGVTVRSIADLAKYMEDIRECGYEADRVTVLDKASWQKRFSKTKLVRRRDPCKMFRRQKDPGELRLMKRALQITEELLRRVPSMLKRKITEEKLARQLQIWALELGADGMAFDPIVAFGSHTGCPHHVPTARPLRKGHIVQIDVGAKYKGYCADLSEVYFTARPTKTQMRMYKVVARACTDAMEAVEAGVTTHELDKIAREVLKTEDVEEAFIHALGHGVGLEIHEGLSISQKRKAVELLENEVITIEPGIYFPGRFGMRVERMVFVK